MKHDRWMPNSGEIFKGDKPEQIAPIDAEKVLDILIGQLKVLHMLSCPAIYIPREQASGDTKI